MNILLCERVNEANEYTEQLAKAYQQEGHKVILDVQNFLFSDFKPSFIHIQWPEAIYKWRHKLPPTYDSLNLINKRLLFYKKSNVPIVYTVHNMLPHSNPTDFDKAVYALIANFANIFVHHGNASIDLITKINPTIKNAIHIICPLGPYPRINIDSEIARNKYGLPRSKYVILNFGRQRKNKGYKFVKNVFKQWNHSNAFLFTLGPKEQKLIHISPEFDKILSSAINYISSHKQLATSLLSRREKSVFRNFNHQETPYIIAASDVFLLGHQEGLNSGIAALAASYGKPIISPNLGNFKQILNNWNWCEIYNAGNMNSAVDALNRMYERIRAQRPGTVIFNNEQWLESNSWQKHVNQILKTIKEFTPTN